MLKNALIFAIAAITAAFAAPSLIVAPGGGGARGVPARDAVAVAVAPAAPATLAEAEPTAPSYREASIAADPGGQYRAKALIDGQDVDVMIDTGATVVALTAETAARLGVTIEPSRPRWKMNNGVAFASPVTLRSVGLGAIYMDDVLAVVMPAGASSINLLGASFLKRLVSVEQRGGMLVLRQ